MGLDRRSSVDPKAGALEQFLQGQHVAGVAEAGDGPALGTAIRFEPGDTREVQLVPMAGNRQVYGFNGLVNGPLD